MQLTQNKREAKYNNIYTQTLKCNDRENRIRKKYCICLKLFSQLGHLIITIPNKSRFSITSA